MITRPTDFLDFLRIGLGHGHLDIQKTSIRILLEGPPVTVGTA